MSADDEKTPAQEEQAVAPRPAETGPAPTRGSRPRDLGIVVLSFLLYLVLLDAAVETVLSASPLRWLVGGIVAGYAALSAVLWRRLGWAARAAGALIVLLGLITSTAWLPEGLSHGIAIFQQPTAAVLSWTTVLAILLAGFRSMRLRFVPVAGKAVAVFLAAYGAAAFALAAAAHVPYADLFHGRSLWDHLPFWLQGAFLGALVLLPAGLLVHLMHGALSVRGRQLRAWAIQGVVLSAGLGMAAAGFLGPAGMRAGTQGGIVPILPGGRTQTAPQPSGPELAFSVNHSVRPKVTSGTPLIFEIMIRNGAAAEAAVAAQARETLKENLDNQVRAGRLSRQAADARLKAEPIPTPVPAMVITLDTRGISFSQETPQGAVALPWQSKAVEPGAPIRVALDAAQIAYATFVVTPEDTAATPPGRYRVRASLENRSSGQWQGRVTSNPVVITVAQAPAAPTLADQKAQQRRQIEYFLALSDYGHAAAAGRQILTLDPHSIDGFAYLAKALQGKGELRAALEAYESALLEFRLRYPGNHPPEGLQREVWRLRDQLGIKLPEAVTAPK